MVIPSSLTPPPSTQVAAHNNARRTFSQSQQSVLCSPPATILNNVRDREVTIDYSPPSPRQVSEAPPDELRSMLQTCIAEQQKLKMETAHHKLQYNLLSIQAEDDGKRAAVEHEMIRREVNILWMAEHTRQARQELSTSSDSTQAKCLQMKMRYEAAMEENETLNRRLKVAKKVIQQKEEEIMCLTEERSLLLTRIRENREHFHMLCSPGGIFHTALTPKQQSFSTPQQHRVSRRASQQTPRSSQREDTEGREYGLSALLQAMSQSQENNNGAPSTPMTSHRTVQKHSGRHSRNAQSLSSLPTTPVSRSRDGGLLPSVDLVPQTEPRHRHTEQQFAPLTPTPKRDRRRKSRESTISADDNEELARQALESVEAMHAFISHGSNSATRASRQRRRADEADDDEEVFGSQASQAATEMLRRHAGRSFEVAGSAGARDESPGPEPWPVEKSARLQGRLLPSARGGGGGIMDKRKFSGNATALDNSRREHGSPSKKLKVGLLTEEQRVGLGIQYSR
ncbi:hypothetical protein ED733_007521 [Metarhizium rileyi]|uniref:FAD-dependent oxidoreductase-like enzyme n=1 Tax=Metarhizium rileyi (strain RCEF 4871) TaxID=1649241 RepID=A0A5C6GJB1_METRR|nr:hypothetical protein ED733_007521 [Metarhizium rileyi]